MSELDKGELATEQMFAMIGRAITQWSFVEHRLCSIFTVCAGDVVARQEEGLDFGDSGGQTAIFYSVENFRGKLLLIDAAIGHHVPTWTDWGTDIHAEWKKLRDKTRKLSLRRNKLAHHTVLPGFDYEEQTIEPRLVPPYGSPGYWRTASRQTESTQTLQHLTHLEHAFYLLEQKLNQFAYRIASQEELFDIYVELMVRRIRSHYQSDSRRAERLRSALPLAV